MLGPLQKEWPEVFSLKVKQDKLNFPQLSNETIHNLRIAMLKRQIMVNVKQDEALHTGVGM